LPFAACAVWQKNNNHASKLQKLNLLKNDVALLCRKQWKEICHIHKVTLLLTSSIIFHPIVFTLKKCKRDANQSHTTTVAQWDSSSKKVFLQNNKTSIYETYLINIS
jgi:hypothetical protein